MSGSRGRLSPSEYVELRQAIEEDYVEGRVLVREDGWLISETETRVLGVSQGRDRWRLKALWPWGRQSKG